MKVTRGSVSRWEDEVKKEIPIPKCLIVKLPWKRTVKDTVVIAVYKFKVQVLKRKREKYKVMLQTEIAETTGRPARFEDRKVVVYINLLNP